MTNLPKNLPIDGIDKNEKIVCNTKDDLVCKINEIIDYLQAKEEASKGECMRAGWCDSCDTVHKSPFEDGRYKNPPEHEERVYKVAETDTDIIKFVEVTEEYVSKEKIREAIENNSWNEDPHLVVKHKLLKSLGLED